jgi:MFS family permease
MAAGAFLTVGATVVSSLGAFLFGLDMGYIGPILECADFKRDVAQLVDWEEEHSRIPAKDAGFIVSIFALGSVTMAFPLVRRYLLDVWGRRATIILGSNIFILGCVCQARAFSLAVMFAGRFVSGCAIGLLSSVVPLYQSEMAPPRLRGALTSMYQLMLTAGIFIAALLDLELLSRKDGWRLAVWLQVIPAGAILLFMPFLPRSPRWLVQQGRKEEAKKVLIRLRGEEAAGTEYQGIVDDVEESLSLGEPSWREGVLANWWPWDRACNFSSS